MCIQKWCLLFVNIVMKFRVSCHRTLNVVTVTGTRLLPVSASVIYFHPHHTRKWGDIFFLVFQRQSKHNSEKKCIVILDIFLLTKATDQSDHVYVVTLYSICHFLFVSCPCIAVAVVLVSPVYTVWYREITYPPFVCLSVTSLNYSILFWNYKW